MQKLIVLACSLALLATPACKRKRHPNPMATIETESPLSSSVSISDTAASSQLLSGFHGLEDGAWRWSMKKFAVSLAVPQAAVSKGGTLKLKFTLPDVIADRMRGVAITPSIGDQKLAPYTASNTGEQTAAFDVPANLLNAAAVIVTFELDKAVPPGPSESRELGLIIAQVSLEPK